MTFMWAAIVMAIFACLLSEFRVRKAKERGFEEGFDAGFGAGYQEGNLQTRKKALEILDGVIGKELPVLSKERADEVRAKDEEKAKELKRLAGIR